MQKSIIILVRHGTSVPSIEIPEPLWPLSRIGRIQAQELSKTLQTLPISRLYSSPFPRAVDTLRPLADKLDLEIELNYDLRERKLAGEFIEDLYSAVEQTWKDFDFTFPDGESSRSAQNRIISIIKQIALHNLDKTVVIASHGNALALFLASIDPAFNFFSWKTMKNPDTFTIVFDGIRFYRDNYIG